MDKEEDSRAGVLRYSREENESADEAKRAIPSAAKGRNKGLRLGDLE
jgi:hypothetical protein